MIWHFDLKKKLLIEKDILKSNYRNDKDILLAIEESYGILKTGLCDDIKVIVKYVRENDSPIANLANKKFNNY